MALPLMHSGSPGRSRPAFDYILPISLALSLFLVYQGALTGLVREWSSSNIYSFGFIVPVISLWFLWIRREWILSAPRNQAPITGFVILAAGISILWAGHTSGLIVLQQLSLPLTLAGVVLALYGFAVLRQTWFPLAYLYLGIPVWDMMTGWLHFRSQLLSATVAEKILQTLGVPVFRNSIFLSLPNITLKVEQLCSGVNFLIAVVALSVPVSILFLRTWTKRIILVAGALVVALLSNAVRITLIAILSYKELSSALHGPFHLLQGLFVSFAGYAAILLGLRILIGRNWRQGLLLARNGSSPADDRRIRPISNSTEKKVGLFLTAALLAVAVLMRLPVMKTVPLKKELALFPYTIDMWTGMDSKPIMDTVEWGSMNSYISREYQKNGEAVNLSIGYYQNQFQDKELINHRTRLLQPRIRISELTVPGGPVISINKYLEERNGRKFLVYFWYDLDGRFYADYLAAKLYSLRHAITTRRTNGAIIVLSKEVRDPDSLQTDAALLNGFVVSTVNLVRQFLPGIRELQERQDASIGEVGMEKVAFAASFLIIFYIYLGYPLLMFFLSQIRQKEVRKGSWEPNVSIIISAFNEETCIDRTIQNKLELKYPKDRLEIIVVSDGSTDRTDATVRNFEHGNIRLIRQERAGKTAAINKAAAQAKGEILVFSDANSIYHAEALKRLVSNFTDPEVGYVTGKMIYIDKSGSPIGDGCTAYMRYENLLRAFESRTHSIVGVDGGIDAMRRSLFEPMRPDQLPDLILPLRVFESGHRVIYEPSAVLEENALASGRDEYSMRVRVALRSLRALFDMRNLLNPFRHPLYAWQLLSHKVLRYTAFLFLLIFLLSNATLAGQGSAYMGMLIAQVSFYSCAGISAAFERKGRTLRILYIPYYFCLVNLAAAHAFVKFMAGQRQTIWEPRKGA